MYKVYDSNLNPSFIRAYQWGSFVNETWNGMVGMVKRNEVDIMISELTLTQERSTAVHYLPTLTNIPVQLFLRNPGDNTNFYAYLEPFSLFSWIGALVLLFVVPPVLAGIVAYSMDDVSDKFQLGNCYAFFAKIFMMRADMETPRSNSGRIAFGSAFFVGISIFYLWEAMLISYLNVRKTALPIRTLYDLSEASDYRLIAGRGSMLVDQFKYSKNPLYSKIWKEKMESYEMDFPLFENVAKATLDDPYSVVISEGSFKYEEAYLNCKIVDTKAIISTSQLGWAVQKQSPLAGTFTYHISKLKEIGTISRYAQAYKTFDQFCPNFSGKPISTNQVLTAFVILLFGVIGCMLLLILERYTSLKWIDWFLKFGSLFKNTQKLRRAAGIPSSTTLRPHLLDEGDKMYRASKKDEKYLIKTNMELRKIIADLKNQISFYEERSSHTVVERL